MPQKSLGLIETKGLSGAIAAADAAAKAAQIELAACEVTTASCVMLRIEGELEQVQIAIEAATTVARKLGQYLTAKVIPRPHEGLQPLLQVRGYINHVTDQRSTAKPQAEPKPQKKPTPPPPKREISPTPVAPPPQAAPKVEPKPEPKPAPSPAPPQQPAPASEPKPKPQPAPEPEPPKPKEPAGQQHDMAELEKMPVVKLRRYARGIDGLPIQGREISMANKSQLLEAIRSTLGG